MGNGDDKVHAIAASLLDYIAAHPDAADSVEGIRRWWLPSHIAACTLSVEAALKHLVKAGALACRPLPDGDVLYLRRRI